MPVYYEPVTLPERCLLREVLYWLAFQRLPVYETDHEGIDVRESRETADYIIEVGASFVYPDECKRAGIPMDDPDYLVAIDEASSTLTPSFYDQYLDRVDLDDEFRQHLEKERQEAIAFEQQRELWRPQYLQAIEYSTSRIFIALKSGQLRGRGRLLPTANLDEAKALGANGDIFDIEPSEILAAFWSLQGIDFESSAARSGAVTYCHISFQTIDVISLFPGDREPVESVQRIGNTLVVAEGTKSPPVRGNRGRPSYPWEPFHIEVARLLRENQLPLKKEAAIQYFQTWFPKELNVSPSRAAIGEKLTGYYERLLRRDGQKI